MKVLDFKVVGKLENLRKISDFINYAIQDFSLSSENGFNVHTAVAEACENIIQYGYQKGKEGLIEIRCELKDNEIIVRIRDWGKAFNPESVPMPNLESSLEERTCGGLGIENLDG